MWHLMPRRTVAMTKTRGRLRQHFLKDEQADPGQLVEAAEFAEDGAAAGFMWR